MSLASQLKNPFPYFAPGIVDIPKTKILDGNLLDVTINSGPEGMLVRGTATPAYVNTDSSGKRRLVRGEIIAGNCRYSSKDGLEDNVSEVLGMLEGFLEGSGNLVTPLGIALAQHWEQIYDSPHKGDVYRRVGKTGMVEELHLRRQGPFTTVSTSILLTTDLYSFRAPMLYAQWTQIGQGKNVGDEVMRQARELESYAQD